MTKSLLNKILISSLGAGLICAVSTTKSPNPKKMTEPIIVSTIPVQVVENGKTKTLNIPVYDEYSVPKNYCSRYIRFAAKDIFGLEYPKKDAWNQRYHNHIVAELKEESQLEKLVCEGKIKPGEIIGVYNPKSLYNLRKDEADKKVEYTHVALYLGTNCFGEPLLAHHYGKKTEVISVSELRKRGLMPKEALSLNR